MMNLTQVPAGGSRDPARRRRGVKVMAGGVGALRWGLDRPQAQTARRRKVRRSGVPRGDDQAVTVAAARYRTVRWWRTGCGGGLD